MAYINGGGKKKETSYCIEEKMNEYYMDYS